MHTGMSVHKVAGKVDVSPMQAFPWSVSLLLPRSLRRIIAIGSQQELIKILLVHLSVVSWCQYSLCDDRSTTWILLEPLECHLALALK